MTLKIREKSAVLFVVAALLPIILISSGSFIVARNALSEFVTADLSHTTRETLRGLERYFADVVTHLRTWSTHGVFREALVEGDAAAIRTELVRLRRHYPQFAEFLVVGRNGQVGAATQPARHGQDVSGEEFFAETQAGRFYQGPVRTSEVNGETAMTFAVPIRGDAGAAAAVVATLVGIIDWARIRDLLATVTMAGAEQDADHVLVLTERANAEVLYKTAGSTADLQTLLAIEGRGSDLGFARENDQFIAYSAPSMSLGMLANPDWTLHAIVSSDVAFAKINRLRIQLVVAAAIVFAAALGIGWFGANNLVRPISSMIAALNRIAAGNDATEIPAVSRRDEIGAMARALRVFKESVTRTRQINQDLRQAHADLNELNQDLEERVQMRTRELRAVQDQLLRNERLATLGEVTHTVSVELRNPLSTIRGSLFVIRDKLGGEGFELERVFERIERNIHRCDSLIEDLLNFSRTREFNRVDTDLDAWLGEVLADFATPGDIDIRSELLSGAEISIDRDQLRRAVVSLLDNACQAMTDDGAAVHGKNEREIMVRSAKADDSVEITVDDTGPGVPEDMLAHVFEPLCSTRPAGIGFGLPMLRHIVERHGGTATLANREDGGARAVIRLPLAPEAIVALA